MKEKLAIIIATNLAMSVIIYVVARILFVGPFEWGGILLSFTDTMYGWTGFVPWVEYTVELPLLIALTIGFNIVAVREFVKENNAKVSHSKKVRLTAPCR